MILSRLAVKRPVTIAMFFAVVIVTGVISFTKMQLAWLPTVDFPFVWIWAPYPNSSPCPLRASAGCRMCPGAASA